MRLPLARTHENAPDFARDDDARLQTRCLWLLVALNRARATLGRFERIAHHRVSDARADAERAERWYRACVDELRARSTAGADRSSPLWRGVR